MRNATCAAVVACCLVGCRFQTTCKVDGDCDFGYQCAPGQQDTVRECIKAGSSTASSSSSGSLSTGGASTSLAASSMGGSSTGGSSGNTSSGNVSLGSSSSSVASGVSSSGASSLGDSSSSSSVGSSSSTGSASASLDVTDTGRVCDALFAGLQRSEMLRVQPEYEVDCSPAFANEAEALEMVAGHVQRETECRTNPPGRLYALALDLTSRAVLSRTNVEACINGGRAQRTFQGRVLVADGGVRDISQLRDLYTASVMECLASVMLPTTGDTMGPDGGCRDMLDCAPRDGGVACVRPSALCGAQDLPRCVPLGSVGDPCGEWHPPCRQPLVCPSSGTARTCTAPAVLNGACGGISNIPCQGDLVCLMGACRTRRAANETCEPGAPQCEPGLVCLENGRCSPPRTAGGSCNNRFDCAPCLQCYTPSDDGGVRGGAASCAAPVGPGESCRGAPCHAGLLCVAPGVCAPLARLGENCVLSFTQGEDGFDSHGNCARNTACVPPGDGGTQRVCVARGGVGSPCSVVPGVPFPIPGSCASGLTCARPSAISSTGTCVGPANFGQTCCQADCTYASGSCVQSYGDIPVVCRGIADGGSQCWPLPGVNGTVCASSSECAANLACVDADGGTPVSGWGVCGSPPGQGLPCNPGVEASTPGHACEALLYCSQNNSTCTQQQAAGTPCSFNGQCQGYCAADGGCANARPNGTACDADVQCADGVCYDGLCTNAACRPPTPVFNFDLLSLLDRIVAWLFLG